MTAPAAFLDVELSLTGRRWTARGQAAGDTSARLEAERTGLALSQRLGLPEILGQVLAARGVGLDDAEEFLNPTLRARLTDPYDLKDMAKAAERLAAAVIKGEKIAVFGDYDVDGATSTALLYRFLTKTFDETAIDAATDTIVLDNQAFDDRIGSVFAFLGRETTDDCDRAGADALREHQLIKRDDVATAYSVDAIAGDIVEGRGASRDQNRHAVIRSAPDAFPIGEVT